jgi:predicted Rossmann fold nucleotide-binding protein DprA/Smf involved in DNA uptake
MNGPRLALFAVAQLPGVGERTLCRFRDTALRRGEEFDAALQRPPTTLARDYGLPGRAVEFLRRHGPAHLRQCSELVARLEVAGIEMAAHGCVAYPRRLDAHLDRPPPLLFLHGAVGALETDTVAILSSREITASTVGAAVAATRSAASEQLCVVTGGMKSTHRVAATTVRAGRVMRVVVLDRGILAAFGGDLERDPFGFGPQRSPFDRGSCLVVSRFRPQDHAVASNGRRRDEMIAALADIVFVTNARPGGLIEHICGAAIDRGQCVLVWQGENRGLIAAGAQPVDESDLKMGLRRFLAPPG